MAQYISGLDFNKNKSRTSIFGIIYFLEELR